jgi:hypothetical protein
MWNFVQRAFRRPIIGAILLLGISGAAVAAAPVGTGFTYQGKLASRGQPAEGLYDFQFSLWDAAAEGNSVAGSAATNAVQVTNGLFNVSLDFGSAAFDGNARWLEIAVRTNGASSFVTLAPRQPLTASPYALYALNSGTAPDLSGAITATNSANQFQGAFAGNGAGLTNLIVPSGSITGTQLAAQSVSVTNLTLTDALRIACGDIADYGINRFGWTHTLAKLSANGLLGVTTVGNGWAEDSDFGGFITNLLTYKPLAGFASSVVYYSPQSLSYGPNTGKDTALFCNGDDTNWHGSYFVLTNAGNIAAPVANCPGATNSVFTSDICGIHYLANPNGGSFVAEIRTNGAWGYDFLNLDSTWTTVANVNASNPSWMGKTVWWTNSQPVLTQIRVRATSPGWTPVVGFAQWNSTLTNGVVLSQYSHQASGNWWTYTDTNKVFPIWQAWRPDLVLHTGGLDDSRYQDAVGLLGLARSGFPGADLANVATHLVMTPWTNALERQFCFGQGIPYFDGQAATAAAWGSYSNGVSLGLYQDTAHLTAKGYAAFGQLVWSWMGLTSSSPLPCLEANGSGISTNISVGGVTLYITNGSVGRVTAP